MVLWLYSTVLMVAFLSTLIATMPSNVLVSEADTVTARVYRLFMIEGVERSAAVGL
ncbi:Uncharacterised protein [Mycobacteroides abscessus]|nr:Uncharacterised protein [Mycobacteroides abscessus]